FGSPQLRKIGALHRQAPAIAGFGVIEGDGGDPVGHLIQHQFVVLARHDGLLFLQFSAPRLDAISPLRDSWQPPPALLAAPSGTLGSPLRDPWLNQVVPVSRRRTVAAPCTASLVSGAIGDRRM